MPKLAQRVYPYIWGTMTARRASTTRCFPVRASVQRARVGVEAILTACRHDDEQDSMEQMRRYLGTSACKPSLGCADSSASTTSSGSTSAGDISAEAIEESVERALR
jgi:hypothetical protein